MQNCTYTINGIGSRIIKYQIFTDNDTVFIYTDVRNWTVKFEDMPETLRHWIPVLDEEPSYDHMFAELGLEPLPDNPNLLPEQKKEKNPSDDSTTEIQMMIVTMLKNQNIESADLKEKLRIAMMNSKDEKITGGSTLSKAVNEQTKNIINAVNANTKITTLQFQMLLKTLEMLESLRKNKDD